MTTNGDREFDGIVIGAGHNGMILQGYLLKAGLSVAVVERHLEVGGGLDAHENPRAHGFWHNIHSQNHRAVPNPSPRAPLISTPCSQVDDPAGQRRHRAVPSVHNTYYCY